MNRRFRLSTLILIVTSWNYSFAQQDNVNLVVRIKNRTNDHVAFVILHPSSSWAHASSCTAWGNKVKCYRSGLDLELGPQEFGAINFTLHPYAPGINGDGEIAKKFKVRAIKRDEGEAKSKDFMVEVTANSMLFFYDGRELRKQ